MEVLPSPGRGPRQVSVLGDEAWPDRTCTVLRSRCLPFVHATWPTKTGTTWPYRFVSYWSTWDSLQSLNMTRAKAPTWLSPKWIGNPYAPHSYPLHAGLGGHGPNRPIGLRVIFRPTTGSIFVSSTSRGKQILSNLLNKEVSCVPWVGITLSFLTVLLDIQ